MYMLKKWDIFQWDKYINQLAINMLEECNKKLKKDKHITSHFQILTLEIIFKLQI